jgi:hypothetical protein
VDFPTGCCANTDKLEHVVNSYTRGIRGVSPMHPPFVAAVLDDVPAA